MTNKLIIESLTGQTLEDLGFKITTPTKPADTNYKNVDTILEKYDSVINSPNTSSPEVAKRYITQAINSYNEAGGNRVTDVKGRSDTDIVSGYTFEISFGDKEYKVHAAVGKKIQYKDIINDNLKATVDEAPHGEPIKIDKEWYIVDKQGNKEPILQKVSKASSSNTFNADFIASNGKYHSLYDFTNKKNN